MVQGASLARRLRNRIRRNAETQSSIQNAILNRYAKQQGTRELVYEPAVICNREGPEIDIFHFSQHTDHVISTLENDGITNQWTAPGELESTWHQPIYPEDYVKHEDCDPDFCSPDVPCDLCQEASYSSIKNKRFPAISRIAPRQEQTVVLPEVLSFCPEQVPIYDAEPEPLRVFMTPCALQFSEVHVEGVAAVPVPNDTMLEELQADVHGDDDPFRQLCLLADVEFLSKALCDPKSRRRYAPLKRALRSKLFIRFQKMFSIWKGRRCHCNKKDRYSKDAPACSDSLALTVARHLTPAAANRNTLRTIAYHVTEVFRHIHGGYAKKFLDCGARGWSPGSNPQWADCVP